MGLSLCSCDVRTEPLTQVAPVPPRVKLNLHLRCVSARSTSGTPADSAFLSPAPGSATTASGEKWRNSKEQHQTHLEQLCQILDVNLIQTDHMLIQLSSRKFGFLEFSNTEKEECEQTVMHPRLRLGHISVVNPQ